MDAVPAHPGQSVGRGRRIAGAAFLGATMLRIMPAFLCAGALGAMLLLTSCGHPPPPYAEPKDTIYLAPDGGGDYASLSIAVREAPSGATIRLEPGTYRLSAGLNVFRSLRILGLGEERTIIESDAQGHVVGFERGTRLELRSLTLRHRAVADATNDGRPEPADVLLVRNGRVVLRHCRLEGAETGRLLVRSEDGSTYERAGGAGLRALGDTSLHLVDCTFRDCPLAGVAVEPGVSVTTVDCTGVGTTAVGDRPCRLPGKRGPRDEDRLARFMDAELTALMESMHIAGATAAVVRDGRLLYLRGLGTADLAADSPVDPRRTRFCIASLTKLFTATAVLQLVERDRLSLSTPVSALVDRVPDGPGGSRRLTVADLLTHSAGFDERTIGAAVPGLAAVPTPTDLVSLQPASRILPPSLISSYSNYDMTLAGAVVEAVAGMPYERWVEERILRPLGMHDTSFGPRDASRDGRTADGSVARSYRWGSDHHVLPADEFSSSAAAGLWSSARDMAVFMLVHLEQGRMGGVRIFSAQSGQALHARHFANDDRLPGYAYGFVDRTVQNRRALEHTGEFNGHSSILFLVPSEDLGVFVATNTEQKRFCREVVMRLMRHYYPDRDQLGRPDPPQRLAAGLEQFAGTYRTIRHAHRSLDKVLALSRTRDLRVEAEPGGTLYVDGTRYVQMEPLAFRELDDDMWMAFSRNDAGEVTFAFHGTAAYERLSWWETAQTQRRLMALFVVVFGTAALAWAVVPLLGLAWSDLPDWALRLRRRRLLGTPASGAARVARSLGGVTAVVDLAFLAIIGFALTDDAIRYGIPAWLTAALVLPLFGATLSVAMAGLTVAAWVRGWWTVAGRALYAFVTLVAVLFIWFTAYWNLLGFRY